MKSRRSGLALAAAAGLAMTASALAQPAATDLGTLTVGTPIHLSGIPITASAPAWYRFTLANDVTAASALYLDIDTEGSALTPSNDTMLGSYDSAGAVKATDDDNGSDFMSMLTFGNTTPRPPVGNGSPYNGRNGNLTAGTYYLVVTPYFTTFSAPWGASSTSSNAGNAALNIVLGQVVLGACCSPGGVCTQASSAACATAGGTYGGDNSPCDQAHCPNGACCAPNISGGCVVANASGCTAQGGTYRGDGSACASANCPVPTMCNGGFESGTFSCWTQFGNPGFTAVNAGVWVGVTAHGGTYEAHFGPVTTTGGIQQTVAAHAGDQAVVHFWYACNATTPNYFLATFDNQQLVTFTDDLAHPGWTEFTFPVTIGADNPVLSFTTRHDPQYIFLDDITVTVTPAGGCYANCDGSTTPPVLNVQDFSCFLGKFATGDPYANCDGSTTPPVLNVQDFSCYLGKFAAGCSAP